MTFSRDWNSQAGWRLIKAAIDREVERARAQLGKPTGGSMTWDSRPSPPRSSRFPNQSPSSFPDPTKSLGERFHLSPSGLAVPDSLNPFLLAHPALDTRFGDIMSDQWFTMGSSCVNCGAMVQPGAVHACPSRMPSGWSTATTSGPYYSPSPPAAPSFFCAKCGQTTVGAASCHSDACNKPLLPIEKRAMPVIGYRAWTAEAQWRLGYGTRWRLKSTGVSNSYWESGANTARCNGATMCPAMSEYAEYGMATVGTSSIPNPDCYCGFYVLSQLDEIHWHVSKLASGHVVGAVMGWGRIVQHGDEGWRAQYARIVALLDMKLSDDNDEITRSISTTYGVPIYERKALERYVAEFGDSILEDKGA